MRKAEVPVGLRGAISSTRQVHNFGVPGGVHAERLIACEVVTPSGNWSSYPAHKHDVETASEFRLEEIYYLEFDIAVGSTAPEHADPFGMFTTYSSAAGVIDTSALVRTGDVALVLFGWRVALGGSASLDSW